MFGINHILDPVVEPLWLQIGGIVLFVIICAIVLTAIVLAVIFIRRAVRKKHSAESAGKDNADNVSKDSATGNRIGGAQNDALVKQSDSTDRHG